MMQLSRAMGSAIKRFDYDLRTVSSTMAGTATGARAGFMDTISQIHQAYGPTASGGRPGIDVAPSIGRELMMLLRLATPRQMRGMTGPEIDYYVRRNWEQRFQDLRDWAAMPGEAIPRLFGADTSRGITRLGRDIEGLSQQWVRAPYSEGTIRGTGFTREQARDVASGMLRYRREAVTEFNRSELNEMVGLAGSLGYFDDTQGVEDFQRRFRELSQGVSRMMRVLKTSYQEGVAVMSELREMGITDYAGATDRLRMQSAMTGLSPAHIMQYAGTFAPQIRGMMPGMTAGGAFRVATHLAGARDPAISLDFMGSRVNQLAFMRMEDGRFNYDHGLLTQFLSGGMSYQDVLGRAGRNFNAMSPEQMMQFETQRGDIFSGMPGAMIPMIGGMFAVRRALELSGGNINMAVLIMQQSGLSDAEIQRSLEQYRDYLRDPGMIGRMTAREQILSRQADVAPGSTWHTLRDYGIQAARFAFFPTVTAYEGIAGYFEGRGIARSPLVIAGQRTRTMSQQISDMGINIPRSMRGESFMMNYNQARERMISAIEGDVAPVDLLGVLGASRYRELYGITQRADLSPQQLIAEGVRFGLTSEQELRALYNLAGPRFTEDAIRGAYRFDIEGGGIAGDILARWIDSGHGERRRGKLIRDWAYTNIATRALRRPTADGSILLDLDVKALGDAGLIADLRGAIGDPRKMQEVIEKHGLGDVFEGTSLMDVSRLAQKYLSFHDEAHYVGRTRKEFVAGLIEGKAETLYAPISRDFRGEEGLRLLIDQWDEITKTGMLPEGYYRTVDPAGRGVRLRRSGYERIRPYMEDLMLARTEDPGYLGEHITPHRLTTSPTLDPSGITAHIQSEMYPPLHEIMELVKQLVATNTSTAHAIDLIVKKLEE